MGGDYVCHELGGQISDAAMIAMDGVERVLAKMSDHIELKKVDRPLMLQRLRMLEQALLVRSGRGGVWVTERSLSEISRLKKAMLDLRKNPKTPWRLLGAEISTVIKSDSVIDTLNTISELAPTPRRRINPIDLLVGQELVHLFESTFERDATSARNADGKLRETPFITFAQAVLHEFGIDRAPETIIRAKTNRGRRTDAKRGGLGD